MKIKIRIFLDNGQTIDKEISVPYKNHKVGVDTVKVVEVAMNED